MKRNLFKELMEGINDLKAERLGRKMLKTTTVSDKSDTKKKGK